MKWGIESRMRDRMASATRAIGPLATLLLVGAVAIALTRAFAVVGDPMFVLFAFSGVKAGPGNDIRNAFSALESLGLRFGIAVPILYMRTTGGARADWEFDRAFDTSRRCGNTPLVDDSLDEVIRHAIEHRIPTMFVLNGGIWADSRCDEPRWDLNDYLEQQPENCQWTQSDAVLPDGRLVGLPGAIDSPQLGRSLTFNVHAAKVRSYKQRNLRAAATVIAQFAATRPDLFVGVTLDADTVINPFYNGHEWFDYNPGTIRQFREWLAGSGPYSTAAGNESIAGLRGLGRAEPLSLAEVNVLAGKSWQSWSEVEPPRRLPASPRDPLEVGDRPYWEDPWFAEWDIFRRHLVAVHYEELAGAVVSAGIPRSHVYTAQGFAAPFGRNRPFALRIASKGQNYDAAGVSVEGAKPKSGHLGVILYGRSAKNDVVTENGHSLFHNFATVDKRWAIVETNPSELSAETPAAYADGYTLLRNAFNYGARSITIMAWGDTNRSTLPYMAFRGSPFEQALVDFANAYRSSRRGDQLWTFGGGRFATADEWNAEGATLHVEENRMKVTPLQPTVTLLYPQDAFIYSRSPKRLEFRSLGLRNVSRIEVATRCVGGSSEELVGSRAVTENEPDKGLVIDLSWPCGAKIDRVVVRLHSRTANPFPSFQIQQVALRGGVF